MFSFPLAFIFIFHTCPFHFSFQASPFSLEEKQILLEAENLDVRKNKIAKILSTYTHDVYDNTTIQ